VVADAEEVEVAEVVDQVVEEQRLSLVGDFDETFLLYLMKRE
jgi:hypothetical protein